MSVMPANDIILEGVDLTKHFGGGGLLASPTIVRAVDGVSLGIRRGETFAIVGESGCGKSTLGRLLLRLIEPTAGDVRYEGQSILKLNKSDLRKLRRELQIIFQDPYASLNPRMNVGDIIAEPIWLHDLGIADARSASAWPTSCAPSACCRRTADRYPHEFSGGQRQRIGIARALAGDPKLIIGDEPVSALDVSIQAQIINLLEDLKDRFGLTLVIIAHDLAVIRHMSDRVAVMYLGEIVEIVGHGCPVRQPAASLHAGLARGDPRSEPRKSPAEGAAAGGCAEPGRSAVRLPLPHPLPPCTRAVQGAASGAGSSARRAAGRLPFLARNPGSGRWFHQRAAPERGARQAPGALPNLARTAG